jgi:mono/diheme cytochrome c family protein/plastocyanin
MKKEILAKIIVSLLVLAAAAIPLAGRWFSVQAEPNTIDLHAHKAENGGWSQPDIQAKVGETLKLRITSDDVVHSFAIGQSNRPPLEIQPGQVVEITLTFDKPGTYTFYCTTWCGPNHWRMRGTIDVSGPGPTEQPAAKPLYLTLGLDIDAPHPAGMPPARPPSAERGAAFAGLLPAYATTRSTYLSTSPAQLWQKLRSTPGLGKLSDADLWDSVAWIWQQQSTPQAKAEGQQLYSTNCAACHGETGQGNGVMVRGLPALDYQNMGHSLVHPPDFTDPKTLLGASPALLEGKMIRGGMGTGMPSWGAIFTDEQFDALVRYIYNFAWQTSGQITPVPSRGQIYP